MASIAVLLLVVVTALAGIAIGVALSHPVRPHFDETARIRREASEVAWTIQRRASEAFAQMLDAARDAQRHDDRG